MTINFLGAIHWVLVIRWQNWRLASGKAHHFSKPVSHGWGSGCAGHPAPSSSRHPTGDARSPTHHVTFDMHSHLTVMAERVARVSGNMWAPGCWVRSGYKAAKGRLFHVEWRSDQIRYCGSRIRLVILQNMQKSGLEKTRRYLSVWRKPLLEEPILKILFFDEINKIFS